MSQLPWQMISGCYGELLAGPSLLQSFSEDEWISILELPHLSTLHFCIVSVELFSQQVSLELWGLDRGELITRSGRKSVGEAVIPMAHLVTDGVGEGFLEMVTFFCCSHQAKVQPLVVLSTIFQWDSPELGVMVVKIFTNSPCVPWRSLSLPYLDITTLSVGDLTIQFPLTWLHLCSLLLYSSNPVVLPQEEGRFKVSHSPCSPCWRAEGKAIACPTLYHCQSLVPPFTPIETWGHRPRGHSASIQP